MFEVTKEKKEKILHNLGILSSVERKIISFPYFSSEEVLSLRKCCSEFTFRKATPITKSGVTQDFFVCFPAPKIGMLEKCVNHFNLIFSYPNLACFFSSMFKFNDIAVQKYKKGSAGIGIHRDSQRYRELILIICLAGQSDFFIAKNRDKSSLKIIDDTPGRLIMMAGPGFRNLDEPNNRLLHGVKNVKKGRFSLGLRFDSSLQ